MAASNTILPKPVIRLISVAKAIAHDRDNTAESDSSGRRRASSGTGGRGPVGGPGGGGRRADGGGRGGSGGCVCVRRWAGFILGALDRSDRRPRRAHRWVWRGGGRGGPGPRDRAGRGNGAKAAVRPTSPAQPRRSS